MEDELVTMYTSTWIEETVREMALRIDDDHKYVKQPLLGIAVMNAALYFAADLTMAMRTAVDVFAYDPRSYSRPPDAIVRHRHVLLIDTICETGKTLDDLFTWCERVEAYSVCQAVLLDRHDEKSHANRYVGTKTYPELFWVGYGLDKDGMYRNLRHLDVLNQPWSEEGYTRTDAVKESARE